MRLPRTRDLGEGRPSHRTRGSRRRREWSGETHALGRAEVALRRLSGPRRAPGTGVRPLHESSPISGAMPGFPHILPPPPEAYPPVRAMALSLLRGPTASLIF